MSITIERDFVEASPDGSHRTFMPLNSYRLVDSDGKVLTEWVAWDRLLDELDSADVSESEKAEFRSWVTGASGRMEGATE